MMGDVFMEVHKWKSSGAVAHQHVHLSCCLRWPH